MVGRDEHWRRPDSLLRLRDGLLQVVSLVVCRGGHVLLGAPAVLRHKAWFIAFTCRSEQNDSIAHGPTVQLIAQACGNSNLHAVL